MNRIELRKSTSRPTTHFAISSVGSSAEQGVVYTEYLLATLVLVIFLFLPLPAFGISAVELVMRSIAVFYQHSASLIAIP